MILFLVSCSLGNKEKEYKVVGNALGTTYHITYVGAPIDSISQKLDSIVFSMNHALSTYTKRSLLASFNENNADLWENPDDAKYFMSDMQHFVKMVSLSNGINNGCSGAFDPSAKLLFDEYARAKKAEEYMDSTAVSYAMLHKGMQNIQFDENGFPYKLDSFIQLNFNAIAKGYLVDIIGDYLYANGISQYMVEVGGEMKLKGQNAAGDSWKIGINVPLLEARSDDYFTILQLENTALATSGNYQNFYVVEGKLIGHTLDPRTGKPVINNLKSASILHDDCAVADAYATACMVLGLEESVKIIEQDSTLSAYLIYEEANELKGLYVE